MIIRLANYDVHSSLARIEPAQNQRSAHKPNHLAQSFNQMTADLHVELLRAWQGNYVGQLRNNIYNIIVA